jgi:malate dehydrogenase (quinone)
MSVPHLDTRVIDGEKFLVFGPYAGFSPKFLKAGSYLDLFKSIKLDNLLPILAAGYHNLSLTVYLVKEIFKTHRGRCKMLHEFFPEACNQNWRLYIAGQRVQIIKKDSNTTGKLQFGTEVVASADGSLAAMLGASPGASTSPIIMLEVLEKCFQTGMASADWQQKLAEMVPAYKMDLEKNPERYHELAARAKTLLQL